MSGAAGESRTDMTGLRSEGQVVLWVLLLVCTVTTASAQLKVSACAGDSVLLPCVCEVSSLPEKVSVFWRDKDDSVVLDIKLKAPNYSTQDRKFRGRVFSDPQLNRKGNFSVTMRNVSLSDSGLYVCAIPTLSDQQRVSLAVSDRCDKAAVTPPPPPLPPGASGGGTTVTPTCFIFLLLTPPLLHFL